MVESAFPWAALALPLLVLAAFAIAIAIAIARRRREDACLATIAPDPAPAPVLPVAVWFLVRDCHRGRDRGLATFFDGWMIFEGRRTRFALRAVDLRDARPDLDDVEIVLKAGRRSMLLKGDRTFRRALYAWYRASVPVEGEPTFP